MPTALRGGTKTYWRTRGDGTPEVLLLHCSLARSGVWDRFAARLEMPCVAFDAPGHGQSGPLDPSIDYQLQCSRVAEDFVRDGPMDVIGHSFGATVALRLAVERPEAVRRLVLIEPVLFAAARGMPVFEAHVKSFRPFVAALEAGDPYLAARRFTEIWGTGVDWDAMREEQRRGLADQIHLIPAQNGALFEDNAGLLDAGRLEATGMPVLLVEGTASPAIVGAIQEVLADRLPDATRAPIADAGHMAPITHAAEVAAEVRAFLDARD